MGGVLFPRRFLEPQSRSVQRWFLNPKEPWALSQEAWTGILVHVTLDLGFSPLGSRLTWKMNSWKESRGTCLPCSVLCLALKAHLDFSRTLLLFFVRLSV